MVLKLADWAKKGTDNLDEAQFQDMLQAEHGGMSESLAHLYAITGNKDYLTFAQRFDHKEILDPLGEERRQVGRAITSIHNSPRFSAPPVSTN